MSLQDDLAQILKQLDSLSIKLHSLQQQQPLEPLLTSNQVLGLIPITRWQLLNGCKIGLYPKPIRIGKRKLAWRQSEIAVFLANGCLSIDIPAPVGGEG